MISISIVLLSLVCGYVVSVLTYSIPNEIKIYYFKTGDTNKLITKRFLLIELISVIIFTTISQKIGFNYEFFQVSILFILFLALSIIDYDYMAVPDSLNILSFFVAISSISFFDSFTNGLLFMGGFFLLRVVVSYILQKEAMGEADIILAGSIGALLGWQLAILAIIISSFLALPFSMYQRRRGQEELPFVPFLALGTFIGYLFSNQLLDFWSYIYS